MGDVVDAWHDRSVLVTGAAGFLGSWTVRALAAAGARVTGIDINPGRSTVMDVDARKCDEVLALMNEHTVDTVIHLAAQSIVGDAQSHPLPTFQNNVEGTWSVLEACRNASGVRAIVVASSDKAYGDAKGDEYNETMPLDARNPYDVSKACADMIAQSFASAYALPVAITRCGNLYGGGDLNWSRIVPGTIRSLLRGERPIIRSDGTFVRDYLYVEDAVAGMLMLAAAVSGRDELRGEPFNLAADARHSVLEIVDKIAQLMDVQLAPEIRDEAIGEIREQRLSAAKAHSVLGWQPAFSIDDGLARAVAWYREYLA